MYLGSLHRHRRPHVRRDTTGVLELGTVPPLWIGGGGPGGGRDVCSHPVVGGSWAAHGYMALVRVGCRGAGFKHGATPSVASNPVQQCPHQPLRTTSPQSRVQHQTAPPHTNTNRCCCCHCHDGGSPAQSRIRLLRQHRHLRRHQLRPPALPTATPAPPGLPPQLAPATPC